MSTVPRPRTEGQPKGRKPARPTHGTCRLTLNINGTSYGVRPVQADPSSALQAFRLRKPDGTAYHVARQPYGCECDCPDFVFHREGIDPAGCKHIKALAACGLLAMPPAGPAPSPADERPEWTDTERWTISTDPDDPAGFDPFDPDYIASIRHEGGDA